MPNMEDSIDYYGFKEGDVLKISNTDREFWGIYVGYGLVAHSQQDYFGSNSSTVKLDKTEVLRSNFDVVAVNYKQPLIRWLFMRRECNEDIVIKALQSADNKTSLDNKGFVNYCCYEFRKKMYLMILFVLLAAFLHSQNIFCIIGCYLAQHPAVIIGIICILFIYAGYMVFFLNGHLDLSSASYNTFVGSDLDTASDEMKDESEFKLQIEGLENIEGSDLHTALVEKKDESEFPHQIEGLENIEGSDLQTISVEKKDESEFSHKIEGLVNIETRIFLKYLCVLLFIFIHQLLPFNADEYLTIFIGISCASLFEAYDCIKSCFQQGLKKFITEYCTKMVLFGLLCAFFASQFTIFKFMGQIQNEFCQVIFEFSFALMTFVGPLVLLSRSNIKVNGENSTTIEKCIFLKMLLLYFSLFIFVVGNIAFERQPIVYGISLAGLLLAHEYIGKNLPLQQKNADDCNIGDHEFQRSEDEILYDCWKTIDGRYKRRNKGVVWSVLLMKLICHYPVHAHNN